MSSRLAVFFALTYYIATILLLASASTEVNGFSMLVFCVAFLLLIPIAAFLICAGLLMLLNTK